jgi:phenylalanyl-tRNA synthetase beta chain
MRISFNWLKELVDINIAPEELAKTLTMAGFEVEGIEDLRTFADGVVVGKVVDCQRHPNADKLSVCQVDIGGEKVLNIVCGAANVRADILVPVATVGTYLPAVDLKLRPTKLRGVPSEGMICSLTELGLTEKSEGIHIFTESNLAVGNDVRPLLGLDDAILDLTATANRADALSLVGVAREVAALTGADLHLQESEAIAIATRENKLNLAIADENACPAYIGTVIEGVKIASSPEWLKRKLQSAGIRPINNVVDITNYILLEWGQPLHAFDREKLLSIAETEVLEIGVRFAREGEKITTLDSQQRNLSVANLIITGNERPIALAGVMGGENSEVDSDTQNIVLEAALFDSVVVRRSSRAQSLRSEASIRYERGVNFTGLDLASDRALLLLQELAGGKVVEQKIFDRRPSLTSRGSIELRLTRIARVLGEVKRDRGSGYIEPSEVEQILIALGCQLETIAEEPKIWKVVVPDYRYRDLEREIDLIEEIARLYGYDRFCDTLPNKTEPGYLSFAERSARTIREICRAEGLTELVHYSLVKPSGKEVTLANPLFVEYSALRVDIIDGLIEAFEYNRSQGNGSLNAFEIGHVFQPNDTEIHETDKIGGILGGDFAPQGIWTRGGKEAPMTWYQAKGILASIFQRLNLEVEYLADRQDSRFHPGRTASLWLKNKRLGIFGQLHPQLRQAKGWPEEVYVFELGFDVLLEGLNREELITPKFKNYSSYPSAARDLAFFASVDVSVRDIERVMSKAGGNLLEKVELFDRYQGSSVPEGQHSLAFSLVYRSGDRTLTDAEIEPVHQKVRDALVKQFAVTLRS